MPVTVRLFAALRDRVGEDRVSVFLEEDSSVRDLVEAVVRKHPEVAPFERYLKVAVNSRYVSGDARVVSGDEVAFISPVSGG